ncbi:NADP-dependent oxidoreductase [Rhodococcus sp. 06-156-3C]|uniref:NADP-dependent oxidoreductase n=1 Tax=Nocardiaceae TaxID=85025 RepID=UPI000523056A|nr:MULTISPECIES: NADP-dependent oxidoreductase [Rhodococcus]OZD18237.1 NADP-dependent oxidoreductase [Rhodococcus sp. 06-156-4C]OZD18835.1 NADP-dependent oxidoreductase [Rhodococcus sp. 06-156-3C]OZD22345.1 NADP-dependent oxidoreductase [Rhodococcus sp. 06-156-4a]OZD33929.1 NADP-dependent oxidoreductase [Rhodococcus sp. 06-156-3b]OZD38666.1 NADP-dependent oxidoreductase [Rhodococcus sp. 06-156-3]
MTSASAMNTRIVLQSRPTDEPEVGNFRLEQVPIPQDIAPGELLLRTIYLSVDPYMRGRMSAAKSYAAPVEIDSVMEGGTVCEIVRSAVPNLDPGTIVLAHVGWQEYATVSANQVRPLDPARAPISTAVGVLGMPGFTAYAGLLEIGRPQPGETVVVAAASGPVGSMVGQIARLKGARAVGIAGGPEKTAYIRTLGFDAAVDHRSPTFREDLRAATPDGIDVYFENVGGAIWDAVFPLLNSFARVPVCGLVSQYNGVTREGDHDRTPALLRAILTKSLTVRGFIQNEFVKTQYGAFQRDVASWIDSGSIRYREDIVDGLESAPEALIGLLRGSNFGKVLVRVGPDPTLTPR